MGLPLYPRSKPVAQRLCCAFNLLKALPLKRSAFIMLAHLTQHGLWLLLLLSSLALFQVWLLVALRMHTLTGAMALFVAWIISTILRQGLVPDRRMRASLAVGLTGMLAAVTCWCWAAALLSMELGMPLWESALRLRPHLAWTLVTLNHDLTNGLWLVLALFLAGWKAGKS